LTVGVIMALFLAFFSACLSIRSWYRPKPR
jgi:hypothetical protein